MSERTNYIHFAHQLVTSSKWTTISTAFVIASILGSTQVFSLYSVKMKKNLHYSQLDLAILMSGKEIGACSILASLIAEKIPIRLLLIISSLLNLFGHFTLWVAVTGKIEKPELYQMFILLFVASASQKLADVGSLLNCYKLIPDYQQINLLIKGYVALSGALVVQIMFEMYSGDDSTYALLVNAWLPTCVLMVCVFRMSDSHIDTENSEDIIVLEKFKKILTFTAVLMTILSVYKPNKKFEKAGGFLVCVMMFLPYGVAIKNDLLVWKKMKVRPDEQFDQVEEEAQKQSSVLAQLMDRKPRGSDFTILEAISTLDFALIFLFSLLGLGASTAAVDNMGQLAESMQNDRQILGKIICLISCFKCLGRVCSDVLVKRNKARTPLLLCIALLVSTFGCFILVIPSGMYISALLIGFSSGAQKNLGFKIISEIFGKRNATNLSHFVQLATPIGCFLFNTVTGQIYDREANKLLGSSELKIKEEELICIGIQCFQESIIIWSLAGFLGAAKCFWLYKRTNDFYSHRGDE